MDWSEWRIKDTIFLRYVCVSPSICAQRTGQLDQWTISPKPLKLRTSDLAGNQIERVRTYIMSWPFRLKIVEKGHGHGHVNPLFYVKG